MSTTPDATEPGGDAGSRFKAWLDQAWRRHADEPVAVLDELTARADTLPDDADGASALRLAEHLALAHLGDPAPLQRLLARVPAHPAWADQRQRSQWALDTLAGRPTPAIKPVLRLRALHGVVMVRVHHGDLADARHHLLGGAAQVLPQADADADPDADALKACAATAHNTASDLLALPRDAARDMLMLDAAQLSHRLWSATGAWLNIERADYQLALSHAALGQGAAAQRHAQACLDRCEAEGADAVERFFAHEVLARAAQVLGDTAGVAGHRQHMHTLLADIGDADMRDWCLTTLDKLPA